MDRITKKQECKIYARIEFQLESCFFQNLGCCVSTNVHDVVLINHEHNLHEIRKLLNTWSRRNTTPFGTIVLIKTTAISKITHLFMNLSYPDAKFLYDLNLLLYNFLWDGKQFKIKRSGICQTYEAGGLKMLDVKSFCQS